MPLSSLIKRVTDGGYSFPWRLIKICISTRSDEFATLSNAPTSPCTSEPRGAVEFAANTNSLVTRWMSSSVNRFCRPRLQPAAQAIKIQRRATILMNGERVGKLLLAKELGNTEAQGG